jgi:hypothetical protein
MVASPAEVVAAWLVSKGLGKWPASPGTAADFRVTYALMPVDGDNMLTVYNTGASKEGRLHKTGTVIKKPTVQVRIRSRTDALGWNKGQAVEAAAEACRNDSVIISGTTYTIKSFTLTIPLVPIQQEEVNQRKIFTVNFKLTM